MKTNHSFVSGLIFTFCFCSVLSAQHIILKQTNENGIYKSGDKIRVTLFLNDKTADSVTVKIQQNFSKETFRKLKYNGDSLVIFSETFQVPTTLVFEATSKTESGIIGLIVDPEKFKPATERPADFEKYWESQKKILRALPLTVKSVPVKNTPVGYSCVDMEMNCTGPKPARGYFAKPVSAKPKSLPIVIFFHAAGVKGDWCRS